MLKYSAYKNVLSQIVVEPLWAVMAIMEYSLEFVFDLSLLVLITITHSLKFNVRKKLSHKFIYEFMNRLLCQLFSVVWDGILEAEVSAIRLESLAENWVNRQFFSLQTKKKITYFSVFEKTELQFLCSNNLVRNKIRRLLNKFEDKCQNKVCWAGCIISCTRQ